MSAAAVGLIVFGSVLAVGVSVIFLASWGLYPRSRLRDDYEVRAAGPVREHDVEWAYRQLAAGVRIRRACWSEGVYLERNHGLDIVRAPSGMVHKDRYEWGSARVWHTIATPCDVEAVDWGPA